MTCEGKTAFNHREKRDGTFESICLSCFHIVGRDSTEFSLNLSELSHRCAELDIWILKRGNPRHGHCSNPSD
jgi:hypothetical protein